MPPDFSDLSAKILEEISEKNEINNNKLLHKNNQCVVPGVNYNYDKLFSERFTYDNLLNPLSDIQCNKRSSFFVQCLTDPKLDAYFPNKDDKPSRYSFCKLQQSIFDACCNPNQSNK